MRLLYLCISIAFASISIDLHSKLYSQNEIIENWRLKKSKFLKGSSSKLTNEDDILYYATVSIGTPPQSFTCQVDTGSLGLWVVAKTCVDCHKCNNTFDPTASSSFVSKNVPGELSYGDGTIEEGTKVVDLVRMGDKNPLEAESFTFLLVNSEKNNTMDVDGLIGFSLDNATPGYISFVTTLKTQGKISNRQFALYLNKEGRDINSNLMIDGYDLKKYSTESKFTYIPLATEINGYWTVLCDSVLLDDNLIGFKLPAIIDSGTSLILAPQASLLIITLWFQSQFGCSLYPNSDLIVCSCNPPKGISYPNLIFVLNGKTFELQPSDYFSDPNEEDKCIIGINSNDGDSWILGDVFMKKYYTTFDMDNLRVGFAKARKDSSAWISYLWKFILIITLNL